MTAGGSKLLFVVIALAALGLALGLAYDAGWGSDALLGVTSPEVAPEAKSAEPPQLIANDENRAHTRTVEAQVTLLEVLVVTSSEEPVTSTWVELKSRGRSVRSSRSDENGCVTFRHLVPGNYTVALDPRHLPKGLVARADGGVGVTMSEGQRTRVSLVAVRAASIQGYVLDDRGEPRSGVGVRFARETTLENLGSAVTDELGWYRLDQVPPGGVLVLAQEELTDMIAPAPELLTCSEGATTRHDIKLIACTCVVAGRAIDELGQPFVGARVVAKHPESQHIWSSARTRENGSFELGFLPTGLISFQIDPREELPSSILGFHFLRESPTEVTFNVGPEQNEFVELTGLRAPYFELRGRITGGGPKCTVYAGQGSGVVELQTSAAESSEETTFCLRCGAGPTSVILRMYSSESHEKEAGMLEVTVAVELGTVVERSFQFE